MPDMSRMSNNSTRQLLALFALGATLPVWPLATQDDERNITRLAPISGNMWTFASQTPSTRPSERCL